jgi:hypothetical protein
MKNRAFILVIIIGVVFGIISSFVGFNATKSYAYNEICHERIWGNLMPYEASCAFVHGGFPFGYDLSKTMSDDTRRINGEVPETPALNPDDYRDMLKTGRFYLNFILLSLSWATIILLLTKLYAHSRH